MELSLHNKISEEQTLWWNLYSVTITAILTAFHSSFIMPHYIYAYSLLLILYHASLQL